MVSHEPPSPDTAPPGAHAPEILAPAGGRRAFLAALAAGADAVYCGLKNFSARMAAENFAMEELAALTRLAHDQGRKVYVPVNTLVKSDETAAVGRLVDQLNRYVRPDALIVQDLALIALARETGFSGEIHLSTLANVSFPAALSVARGFPEVRRVVLPRELSIDEIKAMAAACPDDLSLEVFIHGALCFAVSGRCYWSSYMGGKSGLRGRCVQPCRRVYDQGGRKARFFSCQDLWVDVLTKLLLGVPRIASLKIEGRKKGSHYVYHTVSAYRLLRDHPGDSAAKKTALALLDYALGRRGTHYRMLPQRPQNPVDTTVQTGSGLMIGTVKGSRAKPFVVPREALLAEDMLRIGYEDDAWHATFRVGRYVPKKGQLYLKLEARRPPASGSPVFLIDRREPEVEARIQALEGRLAQYPPVVVKDSTFRPRPLRSPRLKGESEEMWVVREGAQAKGVRKGLMGRWLSPASSCLAKEDRRRCVLWLPPVIWPDDQEKMDAAVQGALKKGFRWFVLNAPWQRAFFGREKDLVLWAGPFSNIANELAVERLADLGFSGAIVSPELGKADYAALPAKSPLPLGIVVSGNWPLCVSRTLAPDLSPEQSFVSPKGEEAWACRHDGNAWVFPNWRLDLTPRASMIQKAGYRLLVHLMEPVPPSVHLKDRPGFWNWEIGLQ